MIPRPFSSSSKDTIAGSDKSTAGGGLRGANCSVDVTVGASTDAVDDEGS